MASDLGANSPKTICKTVMIANASTSPILVATAEDISTCIKLKNRLTISVITASPTQPKPREAKVMPNWVAAR